jgi:hypothetical protein
VSLDPASSFGEKMASSELDASGTIPGFSACLVTELGKYILYRLVRQLE